MPSYDERKVSSAVYSASYIPLPLAPESRMRKRMRKSDIKVTFCDGEVVWHLQSMEDPCLAGHR